MIATAELRQFADSCRRMAVATNNAKWLELADRWMQCTDVAAAGETTTKTSCPAEAQGGEAKKGRPFAVAELVA